MLSRRELADLREIEDVVRLGRLRAIEAHRIVLDDGELPTGAETLHVDCSAVGLRDATPVPTFSPGRIVIQQIRQASPTFNAALIAFLEAHRDSDEEKNRLTPAHPYTSSVEDWGPLMRRTWATEYAWMKEPDVAAWIAASRLSVLRALPEHMHEPRAQEALARYVKNVGPAIERLGATVGG